MYAKNLFNFDENNSIDNHLHAYKMREEEKQKRMLFPSFAALEGNN